MSDVIRKAINNTQIVRANVIIEAVEIIRKKVKAEKGADILREQLGLIMGYAKRIREECKG